MDSFIVEESLNSVKVFWLEQDNLIMKLSETAKNIGDADCNVLKIVLFGSVAEKRGVPGSDVDILILLKNDMRPFIERIPEWLEKFEVGFPVDVFPYTIAEIQNPVVKDVMERGIILFKRNK